MMTLLRECFGSVLWCDIQEQYTHNADVNISQTERLSQDPILARQQAGVLLA